MPTPRFLEVPLNRYILQYIDTIRSRFSKCSCRWKYLNRTPRDALTIINNKSKVCSSRNKPIVSKVSTSSSFPSPSLDVTTLIEIVKETVLMNKATQQATVKAIEETCVTCGGPHPDYECLTTSGKTFDACAVVRPYNQEGNRYRPQGDLNYRASNQMGPLSFPPPNVQNNQNYNHYIQNQGNYQAPNNQGFNQQKGQNFNQGNNNYQAPNNQTQVGPSNDFSNYMKTNDVNMRDMKNQISASIYLMPLFVWKKLSLCDLTPTRMTLELATRSIAYSAGIAKDVFMQVGKFTFPADFVVFDYDVDPRVPLILGRPFLRTARALVDVHEEEFIFKRCLTHFETSDSLLGEFADELAFLDPFPLENEDFDLKTDLRKIKYLLNQVPSTESNIESIDPIFEKFTDEPALDYSPLPRDENDDNDDNDDLFDLKSDNDERKKLLNKDKVFNPGILNMGGTQIFNDESKDKNLNDKYLILKDREYSQWVERFINYLEEQTDGEAMINSIKNGNQPLPRVAQVSIAGTTSTEQPLLKDKSM
nr:reverse transcriptase domain-containing protein [Tanacetum cinerariifolium]